VSDWGLGTHKHEREKGNLRHQHHLDGCCDHTKTIVERAGSGPIEGNEEILEYYAHLMRDVGPLVYTRKTYQLTVPFLA
jgi:hypothetical protein